MKISGAVARRILQLCRKKEITIIEICKISGVSQSTVNDIIDGPTMNPGIVTIKKLCEGFGISIRDFFDTPLFEDLDKEIK